jgi:hypothetical protein
MPKWTNIYISPRCQESWASVGVAGKAGMGGEVATVSMACLAFRVAMVGTSEHADKPIININGIPKKKVCVFKFHILIRGA